MQESVSSASDVPEGWGAGVSDHSATKPHVSETKAFLLEQIDQVQPEQYLFRAPAHASDAQRGLSILWLASNDEWKKRVTEHLAVPRLDTLDTTLQFDVDVGQIRRHGLRSDAQHTFWLPLLLSSPTVPSVLSVADEDGAHVPRLTTAEVRWSLAAALAQLTLRSNPDPGVQRARRDVELLLSATFRQLLDAEMRRSVRAAQHQGSESAAARPERHRPSWGLEGIHLRAEHDRRHTLIRLNGAKVAVADATWGDDAALGLARSLGGVRMLVVGCSRDDLRESYRCALPSRPLVISRNERVSAHRRWEQRPEGITSLPIVDRSLGLDGRSESTQRRRAKLQEWVRQRGPATGRCALRVDLLAVASAANYHVLLSMPEQTEAFRPRLTLEWDLARLTGELRAARGELNSTIVAFEGTAGTGPSRALLIQLRREASRLTGVGRELESFLRSLSTGPAATILTRAGKAPGTDLSDLMDRLQAHLTTLDHLIATIDAHPISHLGPGVSMTGTEPDEPPDLTLRRCCRSAAQTGVRLDLLLPTVTGVSALAAEYGPRDDADSDRVHIAVPSTDRIDRRIELLRSRLLTGVHLADPRPHGPTNRANLLNTMVIALVGVTIAVTQGIDTLRGRGGGTIEVDAVVATLLLFAGVQAARIERPGRTKVHGWLARMPYSLGFLSPLPAVLVGVAAAAGALGVFSGWTRIAVCLTVFSTAATCQLALWVYGVHAEREATLWVGRRRLLHNPAESRFLDPWSAFLSQGLQRRLDKVRFAIGTRRMRANRNSSPPRGLGEGDDVPPPNQRLLGELVRWLPLGSIWFAPLLHTVDHGGDGDRVRDGAVIHLHEPGARKLLGEALVQVDSKRAWHILNLVVEDQPGAFATVLERLEEAHTPLGEARRSTADLGATSAPAVDVAASLGVSFGRYATLQMLVSDRHEGRQVADLAKRIRSIPPLRRRKTAHGWSSHRDPVVDVDVSPTPVDPRTAPIRALVGIYEVMVRLPRRDAPRELLRLAQLCERAHLHLVLVHLPSSPPSGEAEDLEELGSPCPPDRPVWLRARIGVTAQSQAGFGASLHQFIAELDPSHRVRVSSVAEFARSTLGIGGETAKGPMLISDRLATTGVGDVTHVLIDTIAQRGVVRTVVETLLRDQVGQEPGEPAPLIEGFSGHATVGRGLITAYLDGTLSEEAEEHLRQRLRVMDPSTRIRCLRRKGWEPQGPARQGVGVRLTWQSPNVPGVLAELVRGLREESGGAVNVSYLLARVAEVDANLGRLVCRLEGVTSEDDGSGGRRLMVKARKDTGSPTDREGVVEHVRQMTEVLSRRMQQLVDVHLEHESDPSVTDRQVFVTADVFTISSEGAASSVEPTAVPVDRTTT